MRVIEQAMLKAIHEVLAGERMAWRSRNTEVECDLTQGCAAVVFLYGNEIARIKRNFLTGRYHGYVTT